MAKLNKQEIAAIASKLHRELTKIAETHRLETLKVYIPSDVYCKVEKYIEKRDILENQCNSITKQLEETIEQLEDILRESISLWWAGRKSKRDILDKIMMHECKMSEVPDIEELKEEVTIAAIDDSFNTTEFIEKQISKFIH